jgi:hypothetical protein
VAGDEEVDLGAGARTEVENDLALIVVVGGVVAPGCLWAKAIIHARVIGRR